MKIAVRGGHCPRVPGASKFLDELTEDRKVKESVIKYLKQLGHEVFDVTPPDTTNSSNADLSFGVNKANTYNVDLFVSIHFNKAYDVYNGFLGSEVCVYSPFDIAQRVVNGLGALGFKNRGQKVRTNLFELKNTNMKAMIIEVCFVESIADVGLYKKLGHDIIGKTIAECIANKKISTIEKSEQKLNSSKHLFSDNWYLSNYPDVRRNEHYKNEPYAHYINYGIKEGRKPLPPVPLEYNEGEYLELNPDVVAAIEKGQFTSGIEHYLMYGFNENRKIFKEK